MTTLMFSKCLQFCTVWRFAEPLSLLCR